MANTDIEYYSMNVLEYKNGFLNKCSEITCFHELLLYRY